MKAKQHKQNLQGGGEPTLGRTNTTSKPLGAETNTAVAMDGRRDPACQRLCVMPTMVEILGTGSEGRWAARHGAEEAELQGLQAILFTNPFP